jgi:hypothetical protein
MLAIGLESGNILLFTSDTVKWQMSFEIKAGYVTYATLLELVSLNIILGWRI